ncbi:MAG: ABC-2 type transport system permease protein [Planctomycetota bacterium]|jgi:ABC-2 type transport system permease protein
MILALELLRLRRSRRPLVAVSCLLLFLGLMLLGFWTYAETQTGGDVEFRYTFENSSYFNGLTFALYAFYFGFLLLLPIFAATEGGVQLAGDTDTGALRLLLTRPLTRTNLFVSKLTAATLLVVFLTGALLLLSLAIGLIAVGWGELRLYPGVLQMTDRPMSLSQGEALRRFAMVWPAASLALMAPLALSFLISAWARNAVNAVSAAVAIYLVLYVIAEISFFEDLRPYLFTDAMPFWRGLLREEIDWAEIGREAARLTGFTCIFLALAHWRLRRREEV